LVAPSNSNSFPWHAIEPPNPAGLLQNMALPEFERRLAGQEQQHLQESIKDNDAEEAHLQGCIGSNEAEKARRQLQLQAAMAEQPNPQFKQMLSQCNIQALQLQEMEFHMVMRDAIISSERQKVEELWTVLGQLATESQIRETAERQGIQMENPEINGVTFLEHSCSSASQAFVAAASSAAAAAAGTVEHSHSPPAATRGGDWTVGPLRRAQDMERSPGRVLVDLELERLRGAEGRVGGKVAVSACASANGIAAIWQSPESRESTGELMPLARLSQRASARRGRDRALRTSVQGGACGLLEVAVVGGLRGEGGGAAGLHGPSGRSRRKRGVLDSLPEGDVPELGGVGGAGGRSCGQAQKRDSAARENSMPATLEVPSNTLFATLPGCAMRRCNHGLRNLSPCLWQSRFCRACLCQPISTTLCTKLFADGLG
jgi:hypothetical protein